MQIEPIILNTLTDQFADRLNTVYAFGSFAAGNLTPESDVDVAFQAEEKLSDVALWKLQNQLAAELSRDVDLIDLNHTTTVLQMQIVSKGRVLFCKDPSQLRQFEAQLAAMHLTLNEDRLEILKSFVNG